MGHARGHRAYRLTIPANAPVEQYWSATAYSRETHALIKDVSRASRSSQIADFQKNGDRSVDLWFGSEAPSGRESNWVPTRKRERFELLVRLYAPTKPLFDKSWKLQDVTKVVAQPGSGGQK